jgi:hypothetical protein
MSTIQQAIANEMRRQAEKYGNKWRSCNEWKALTGECGAGNYHDVLNQKLCSSSSSTLCGFLEKIPANVSHSGENLYRLANFHLGAHPVAAQPAVAQPVAAQPAVAQPVVDQSAVARPVVDQSAVAQPVVDEPFVDESFVDEPVVDQPVVDESTSSAPTLPQDSEMDNIMDIDQPASPVAFLGHQLVVDPMDRQVADLQTKKRTADQAFQDAQQVAQDAHQAAQDAQQAAQDAQQAAQDAQQAAQDAQQAAQDASFTSQCSC